MTRITHLSKWLPLLALPTAALFAGPACADIDLRFESRPIAGPIEAFIRVTDASGPDRQGVTGGVISGFSSTTRAIAAPPVEGGGGGGGGGATGVVELLLGLCALLARIRRRL